MRATMNDDAPDVRNNDVHPVTCQERDVLDRSIHIRCDRADGHEGQHWDKKAQWAWPQGEPVGVGQRWLRGYQPPLNAEPQEVPSLSF